ncbi:MAG: lysophospholipid acyltransferase family protein [Alphaproteobacteria bacterium]|nr:lysophospholipid acyltransferase family protein [Alphaproteobacteria bacterium]
MKKRDALHRFLIDPIVGVFVGIFWIFFKILPLKWATKTAGFLGGVIAPWMTRRNKIAYRNLSIAFPNKTDAEKKEIIKKMWIHFAKFFAEMPHTKEWISDADVEGKEYLKSLRDDDVGGFVCSAHFGNWEFASTYVAQHYFQLHPVYRPANNPWLEKLMFKKRAGVHIPKGSGGARIMLDLLKNGEHIAILCDQRLREGIAVPFFGKMAMTPSAMVSIALKMRLPIVMGCARRLPDGRFKMTVETLPLSQSDNMELAVYETVANMNKVLERWITETPEQWMWIHRRFDKNEYKDL